MNEKVQLLIDNIKKVIVGKDDLIVKTLTAMLAGGHVLIEDTPGLGKTRLAMALAKSVGGEFGRTQFSPDLAASDIIGSIVMNPATKQYEYRRGIAFCNFYMADDINRCSPKVQSNLVELMEARQISIDRIVRKAPVPFMVLGTQNPIEAYGGERLSEAELDRFMMKISIGYPSAMEEIEILDRADETDHAQNIEAVLTLDDVNQMVEEVKNVKVTVPVKQYITDIVRATRTSDLFTYGASPRASIALYRSAKAHAYINGRTEVTPADVDALAECVLVHRVVLSTMGRSTCKNIEGAIERLVAKVPAPTI